MAPAEALGRFRLARWTRGAEAPSPASGDRLELAVDGRGALRGWLADAAGHGEVGEAFWRDHGGPIAAAWGAHPHDLRGLGRALNAHCHAAGYLALLAFSWRVDGALSLVTWGWGVHALVETAAGPWWPSFGERVGLKLGWLPPADWETAPRACPVHQIEGARRVLLLTDGFLGDDHRDPTATYETLRRIGETTAALPLEEVIPWLLSNHPPDEDDATVAAIALT